MDESSISSLWDFIRHSVVHFAACGQEVLSSGRSI